MVHRKSYSRSRDRLGPGSWLITINAHDGMHLFGAVVAGRVEMNLLGSIVHSCWTEIPAHFAHARIGESIVMPNHMHGVLMLDAAASERGRFSSRREDFGAPVPGSVATIIRSFKAAATRLIRERVSVPVVVWHRGFHAIRITDREGLERAQRYVRTNPERWKEQAPPKALRVHLVPTVSLLLIDPSGSERV